MALSEKPGTHEGRSSSGKDISIVSYNAFNQGRQSYHIHVTQLHQAHYRSLRA
jgi:hypothetical protein